MAAHHEQPRRLRPLQRHRLQLRCYGPGALTVEMEALYRPHDVLAQGIPRPPAQYRRAGMERTTLALLLQKSCRGHARCLRYTRQAQQRYAHHQCARAYRELHQRAAALPAVARSLSVQCQTQERQIAFRGKTCVVPIGRRDDRQEGCMKAEECERIAFKVAKYEDMRWW